jgi:hypothetical protein
MAEFPPADVTTVALPRHEDYIRKYAGITRISNILTCRARGNTELESDRAGTLIQLIGRKEPELVRHLFQVHVLCFPKSAAY